MVKLLAYARLIRLPILVLIAFIQYAARYFIIKPMLDINGFELMMSDRTFALLVLATVLIAAGGYAINDYFDVKIDRVNKSTKELKKDLTKKTAFVVFTLILVGYLTQLLLVKLAFRAHVSFVPLAALLFLIYYFSGIDKLVIIDRIIKRRIAMALHVVLSALGMLIAGYVCWHIGLWKLSALFIFAIFTLWYYSTTLQHQVFAGNLAIALMSAFVPLVVGLTEIPLQNAAHPESVKQLGYSIFNIPAYWLLGLSATIFILTLIREITKDVIDLRGDRIFGSKTIPNQFGIKVTKSILIGLYALFGGLFTWVYFEFLSVHIGLSTVFAVVALLIILEFILIFRARTKPHFLHSANLNVLITMILILSTYLIKVSIESYFA